MLMREGDGPRPEIRPSGKRRRCLALSMSDLLSMTSGLAKLFRAVAFTLLLRDALRRKKPRGAWIYW